MVQYWSENQFILKLFKGLLLVVFIQICFISNVRAIGESHSYVIFRDDFEDRSLDKWVIEIPPDAPEGSTWNILLDEGSIVLSLQGHVTIEAGLYSWENYTVEFRFKFITPNQAGHASVRMKQGISRYFIRFDGMDLRLIENIEPDLIDVVVVDCPLDANQWYSMKIVCEGNRIGVFVDNVLKINYIDSENQIRSGKFGIEGGMESHLFFNEVEVRSTQDVYAMTLLEIAEKSINNARIDGYDTSLVEKKLNDAYSAYNNGVYMEASDYGKEVLEEIKVMREEGKSEISPVNELSPFVFPLSIQEVTGLLTILTMFVGVGGWFYRKRTQSRRSKILIYKFMEEIDEVFSRYKMNAVRCESELLRLKSDVLDEFKGGVIDENNFETLDKRIDFYLKEIRDELTRN